MGNSLQTHDIISPDYKKFPKTARKISPLYTPYREENTTNFLLSHPQKLSLPLKILQPPSLFSRISRPRNHFRPCTLALAQVRQSIKAGDHTIVAYGVQKSREYNSSPAGMNYARDPRQPLIFFPALLFRLFGGFVFFLP